MGVRPDGTIEREESIYSTGKTCDTKKDQLERIADGVELLAATYGVDMNDYYTKSESDDRFTKRDDSGAFVTTVVDGNAMQDPAFVMQKEGVDVFRLYNFSGAITSAETGVNYPDGANIIDTTKPIEISGNKEVNIAGSKTSIGAPGKEAGFFGESNTQIVAPVLLSGSTPEQVAINAIINALKAYGLFS